MLCSVAIVVAMWLRLAFLFLVSLRSFTERAAAHHSARINPQSFLQMPLVSATVEHDGADLRICLRGTFLNIDAEGAAGFAPMPRCASAPAVGVLHGASAVEAAYVDALSERLRVAWSGRPMAPAPGCAQWLKAPASSGSAGHPYVCSRPCLYFPTGACEGGAACGFCHLPHLKRRVSLSRRSKDALEAMPPATALALVMPLLRKKVLAIDQSDETRSLIDRLSSAWGQGLPGARRVRHDGGHRSLAVALAGAELRPLLVALEATALKEIADARVAVGELLCHLRKVIELSH